MKFYETLEAGKNCFPYSCLGNIKYSITYFALLTSTLLFNSATPKIKQIEGHV